MTGSDELTLENSVRPGLVAKLTRAVHKSQCGGSRHKAAVPARRTRRGCWPKSSTAPFLRCAGAACRFADASSHRAGMACRRPQSDVRSIDVTSDRVHDVHQRRFSPDCRYAPASSCSASFRSSASSPIGLAYLTGDVEVGRAFDSVHRNTEVADASRDLKTGLLIMRAATTEFVAQPSDAEVKDFDDGQALAMRCLDRIQASLPLRAAGLRHAAAHHGARPQGQLRQPRQRAEIARLQRNPGHDRRSHRGEQRGREHHPKRSVLGRRCRQRQADDVASHHAALRDRISADARPGCRAAFPRRGQAFQRAVRTRSTARRR